MSKSFIVLKPESALYIDTILNELNQNGYSFYAPQLITNYQSFAREIYYIANYIKDPKYYEIIVACIEAEILLFGNVGLLLGVQNDENLMDHLTHLDRLKSKIRKMISLSKTKALQAFIDINKIGMACSASTYGSIQILSSDQKLQEIYKSNTEVGNFVCFYLSYLHSIDAELGIYKKTMDFIQTTEHLRKLKDSEFELAQKYKTFHI